MLGFVLKNWKIVAGCVLAFLVVFAMAKYGNSRYEAGVSKGKVIASDDVLKIQNESWKKYENQIKERTRELDEREETLTKRESDLESVRRVISKDLTSYRTAFSEREIAVKQSVDNLGDDETMNQIRDELTTLFPGE